MKDLKRLSDAEMEIMLVLWRAHEPQTSTAIQKKTEGSRSRGLAAVMTILARLCEKGFVVCDRQYRNNLYAPLVSEEQYKAFEGKSLLARLYGDSLGSLVATLYSGKVIDREDLGDLRRLIDRLSKEG